MHVATGPEIRDFVNRPQGAEFGRPLDDMECLPLSDRNLSRRRGFDRRGLPYGIVHSTRTADYFAVNGSDEIRRNEALFILI